FDQLGEYSRPGGQQIGRGSLVSSEVTVDDLSLTGATISEYTIKTMLRDEITTGKVRAPNSNSLYMVFVDPRIKVLDSNGASYPAFQDVGTFSNDLGTFYSGQTFYFGVVSFGAPGLGFPNTLTAFQNSTVAASHEIAEAVTDPDGHSGYRDNMNINMF